VINQYRRETSPPPPAAPPPPDASAGLLGFLAADAPPPPPKAKRDIWGVRPTKMTDSGTIAGSLVDRTSLLAGVAKVSSKVVPNAERGQPLGTIRRGKRQSELKPEVTTLMHAMGGRGRGEREGRKWREGYQEREGE
jgi:hypothetical protein